MPSSFTISVRMRPSFLFEIELFALPQVTLAEGDQAHMGSIALQNASDLEHQFLLQRAREVSPESAVLDSLQTVVQAQISNFAACPVIGDVIDEQITHLTTNRQ